MQDWRSWSRWFEPGLRHSWFLNIFDVKSFCLFLKIRMLILQLICLYAHIIQFEMSNGDHQRAGEPSSQSYSPAHMKWEWIKLSWLWFDWNLSLKVWVDYFDFTSSLILKFDWNFWWYYSLIFDLSFIDWTCLIYFILNLKFNFDIFIWTCLISFWIWY